MLDFFNKFLRPAQPSGATAKERLRLVLLSDHLSLAPEVVEALKADLLGVISRYVEIDRAHADVTFEHRAGELAMLASVPITGVRRVPHEAALPPPPAPASPDPVRTPAPRAPAAVVSERVPASEPQALELPMASEPTAAAKASHAARRRRRRRKANAAAKRNAQQQGAVQQMNTTAQA